MKDETLDDWKIPNIPDEKVSVEDVKFVFNQAAVKLQGTISNADNITAKSITVFTILVGVVSATLTYPISHWEGVNQMDNKQWVAFAAAFYAFILGGYLMVANIFPKPYHPIGSTPRDFYKPVLFAETPTDARLITIYLNEILSYNTRIEYNVRMNHNRLRRYKHSLVALYLTPLILGTLFLCLERWN